MYSIEPESKCLYSYAHVRDAHIWSDVLYIEALHLINICKLTLALQTLYVSVLM